MQITFDHTDLANPEALSILRRVIGGEVAPSSSTGRDAFYEEVLRSDTYVTVVPDAPLPVPVPTAPAAFPPVPPVFQPGAADELTEITPETLRQIREDDAMQKALDRDAEKLDGLGIDPMTGADLLDSSGVMWDARIHASTRTKVQDGTWKMKRGVEPELVAQVLAELKGQPSPTKVEQFAAQVDPSTLGFGATVPTPPPTVAAVPVPPVPVPLADVGDWPADLLGPHRPGFEFQAFMNYVMGRVNYGVPTPTLLATCKEHDVASFNAVNGRPEVIPALARALSQLQKGA